jgi:hypothetical protein
LAELERRVANFLGFTAVLDSVGQVYPRSLDHDVLSALVQLGAGPSSLAHTIRLMAGHELVTEYGVPSGVGYLLSFDNLELMSMQGQLVGRMEDTDISTATDLKAIDFYGQFKCEAPSFTARLEPENLP